MKTYEKQIVFVVFFEDLGGPGEQFWSNLALYGAMLGQYGAKLEQLAHRTPSKLHLEASGAQVGAKMAAKSAKMSQHDRQDDHFGINLATSWSILTPSWQHPGAKMASWRPSWDQLGTKMLKSSKTYGFPKVFLCFLKGKGPRTPSDSDPHPPPLHRAGGILTSFV